ncbi:MAG: hypothetical protein KGR16_08090, partial [Verrucomicrobia bacterium]|nr:hypothetical protein [Verrucomicrobiota bacterium]
MPIVGTDPTLPKPEGVARRYCEPLITGAYRLGADPALPKLQGVEKRYRPITASIPPLVFGSHPLGSDPTLPKPEGVERRYRSASVPRPRTRSTRGRPLGFGPRSTPLPPFLKDGLWQRQMQGMRSLFTTTDPLTVKLRNWHEETLHTTDRAQAIHKLYALLTDPMQGIPLDEEAQIGNDQITYNSKVLRLWLAMNPLPVHLRQSPLDPASAVPFTATPHRACQHMVKWLRSRATFAKSERETQIDAAFKVLQDAGAIPRLPTPSYVEAERLLSASQAAAEEAEQASDEAAARFAAGIDTEPGNFAAYLHSQAQATARIALMQLEIAERTTVSTTEETAFSLLQFNERMGRLDIKLKEMRRQQELN